MLTHVPTPQAVWYCGCICCRTNLGWCTAGVLPVVPVLDLAIKTATVPQLIPAFAVLGDKHKACLREAWPLVDVSKGRSLLLRALERLWKLRWEDCQKEPFWRLVQSGFAGLTEQGRDPGRVARCPCGARMLQGPRMYHFWDCPIVSDLRAHTGMCEVLDVPLLPRYIWLAVPPASSYRQPLWEVACLACVAALNLGRWRLCRCPAGSRVERAVLIRTST